LKKLQEMLIAENQFAAAAMAGTVKDRKQ